MAQLALRELRKEFKKAVVVDGINLDIADGEFVVLVGPSGCGKSTTLNLIAGLESVTSGEIAIGGRVVTSLPPKDRNVAMVFQSYALYPHMTVAENLGFGLKVTKMRPSEIQRRVLAVAESLGIEALLGRKPRELSGGQRQRVALGRAIIRDPAVFLLDEPLSNLDAQLRGQMRVELKQLQERLRATVVHVTHDQVEAMTLGSRVVVMDRGKIHQVGAPLDVYRRPANVFVARFMGSPSMNLIRCRVHRRGDAVSLRAGDMMLGVSPANRGLIERCGAEEVVAGIRPEHVEVLRSQPSAGLEELGVASVSVVELLGNQTQLNLLLGGTNLVACVSPDCPCRPRDSIRVAVAPTNVHLFEVGERGAALQ